MARLKALAFPLLVLGLPLSAALDRESGSLLIRSYAASEYHAIQQNWSMVQDSRGVLYFANNGGVLEFDGVNWRKIAVDGQEVRQLAIDSRGTIFVGGRGHFGYLAAAPNGPLKFISLLEKVPPADRAFNDVWDVLPTSDGVYFVSSMRVFLYTPSGTVKVFRPPSKTFERAFTFHDEFFITSTASGLLTVLNGDLTPIHIAADDTLVHSSIAAAAGSIPLISFNKHLYRFSPGSIDLFPTKADQYFQEHQIYSLAQLPSGEIAVGTESGGLVLLNQNGELLRTIRRADGLPSNWISSIFSDSQGTTWVTTDNGVARFNLNVTRFGEAQGLHGLTYAVTSFHQTLYVGTSQGLFRMVASSLNEPKFAPVTEVQGQQVSTVAQRSGLLFAGTDHGLFVLDGGKFRRILTRNVYDISDSGTDVNRFYAAGGDGVQLLQHQGQNWNVVSKVTSGQDFYSAAEDADGSVWATGQGSVWHIVFSGTTPKSQEFRQNQGVPEGRTYVSRFRGHLVFASPKGLLKFSDSLRQLVPDTELGPAFADGHLAVSTVREDLAKDIWVTGDGYHGILHGPDLKWFVSPLLPAESGELYWIDFDSGGTCWAAGGTSGSLIRYMRPPVAPLNFSVLLRTVNLTNEDKTIFEGDGPASQLQLPYRNNAVRFEYAAPFFDDSVAVRYQFRLIGNNSNWSSWTKETRKDYTNLFEGNYTFEVRAESPHGVIGPSAGYHFSVQAPWYRSWWAYALYVTGFLLAGWIILRWRLRALEAKNKWLEGVVEERTAEVRTERDQNEALLLNILPRPVASELRSTGSVKPTSFDDVTVCFSDFVGFTLSSEKLPPQELISSLNEYFTAFDEIIGRYGLEKLKTIGDAYMFAGGLPNASPSHAVDAVMAALEMVEVVKRLASPDKGVNWSIRLGLYSGPVVAGVVGVKKFAFDIWGNTVNFAARMESSGSPNRVNLSETTWQRVSAFIDCESRGPVRIKEGREMEMYFAARVKPELLSGPVIDGVPEAFRSRYQNAFSKPPGSFPHPNGSHVN